MTVAARVRSILLAAALAAGSATASAQPAADCPPQAQAPSAQQMAEGQRNARDRGFLWRITKDGRSSYLYGTIHIARPDWMYPGPTLAQALKSSDVVALEMDAMKPETLERMRAGMAALRRPLPDPLAQRLRDRIKQACLPEQMEQAMTPEMLAHTLVAMSMRRDGLDPAYGIDTVYSGLSRGLKKKPVQELETPELQLKLLHGRSPDETRQMVEQTLDMLDSGELRKVMLRVGATWSEGRLDDLADYTAWCQCAKTEADRRLLKRMLDDRNPDLAKKIDALHTAGDRVFAAVGALHMIGDTGLPKLMAGRGYRVERVDFPR
jgi:uncharacterized protein YbaP (TraB family)